MWLDVVATLTTDSSQGDTTPAQLAARLNTAQHSDLKFSMHHRGTRTALNLFIPSLHDSAALETSLLVPSPAPSTRKAAVFAHPYGPLGGSLNDGVVQHLASTLLSHGYIVALFNFRGAGRSKGHTTWTGKAEREDYAAVAAWVVNFAAALQLEDAPQRIDLLLGGYSYGALIAAQCPSAPALLATLADAPSEAFKTAVVAGTRSAQSWYDSHNDVGRTSYSGMRSPRSSYSGVRSPALEVPPRHTPSPLPPAGLDLDALVIDTRYLLISPPLPPVSTFLLPTFFMAGPESVMDPVVARRCAARMLVAWGDDDVFTGVKKYRRWAEKMRAQLETFEDVEVEGATHFWGQSELGVVVEAVERWLAAG
jgi:alpha/beta superfamily hydrolase